MKHNLLFSLLSVSALCSIPHVQAATDASRVLTTVSSFGDFMGSIPDDKISSMKHYLYNQDLQIVAVIETACDQKGTEYFTQYYSPYVYDESGHLVLLDHYQYGLYDYGDRAMHHAAGVIEYRYDDEGNCIEEIEDQSSKTLEYDAEGNCVKEIYYSNGVYSKTLEYSDFSAGRNLPALVVSTHANETFTGEFYEESREYDAQGNLVLSQRICNRDYVEDHGFWQITTAAGDFMQEEHWTYEDGQLALYEKYTNINEETGELIPYLKTVYTVKDAATVGYQSYTYFSGEWYKSGVYQEAVYADFSAVIEGTAIGLVNVVKSAEALNDAILEFTKPVIAEGNVSFNIYRNGELIANVMADDASLLTNEAGNYEYVDHDVTSGNFQYIIQTVVDGVGYCVSNIMTVDLVLALPAASNIKAVASEKDDKNLYHVTVLFRAPENAEDYGFISNELIVGNSQVGEEVSKDPSVNMLHCIIGDETAWVSILTRYKLGKAVSERVWIDVNNLSSIDQVRALGTEDLMIFDLNGRQVNASIENLHGSFIIVKGQKAYKVML